MKKLLSLAFCTAVLFSSCSKYAVPESWKEQNVSFLNRVKEYGSRIDPQQNWVANAGVSSSDVTVVPSNDVDLADFSAASAGTKAGLNTHKADFFRVLWGPKSHHTLVVKIDVPGENVTEWGLYYYNKNDQRIEKPLEKTGSSQITFEGVSDSDCFGVYIVKNGKKFYSESRWNDGLEQDCEYIREAEEKQKTSNRAYIYLKDVTFKINSNDDIIGLDYDRGPWMVICEDIINDRSDNDFNDVVFTVHRPDATHIFVEFAATGASISDVVYFKDQSFGEIHTLLGIGATEMVNVQVDSEPHAFSSLIEVSKEFTMTDGNNGGFFVSSLGIPNNVGAGKKGVAPYLITVPGYMKWCRESIPIFDAYPEFLGWVEDKTKNVDWFMHPVESKVVKKNN